MNCDFCRKGQDTSTLMCDSCGHFKAFEKVDYFTLFSLNVDFNIDLQDLENKYISLQRDVHPDKFKSESKSAISQVKSMQCSVYLNDAYETLKSPRKRAEYLFKINNLEDMLQQKNLMDNEMMMRQLEWRERIETADSKDVSSQLKREIVDLIKDLSLSFREKDFAKAASLTVELAFYDKLKKELKQKSKRS